MAVKIKQGSRLCAAPSCGALLSVVCSSAALTQWARPNAAMCPGRESVAYTSAFFIFMVVVSGVFVLGMRRRRTSSLYPLLSLWSLLGPYLLCHATDLNCLLLFL
jgi:hypothetical protein